MGYSAKVLCDSLSPACVRLTTLEVTLPRIVLAEFNTHRVFSRNSASSRAIPVEKRIAMVQADPFIPEQFGKNQKGMQAAVNLEEEETQRARTAWVYAMSLAVKQAQVLASLGVHKQLANRLLEPFCWQTIVVTATEWKNFFALRRSKEAQPEIKVAADMMFDAMAASSPKPIEEGEWHLPFILDEERGHRWTTGDLCWISAGRCARVSYLTHEGQREPLKDIVLAQQLFAKGHMSPFEHMATPAEAERPFQGEPGNTSWTSQFHGNFRGWLQLRKTFSNEDNFGARTAP
jgi:Thymidylate synthase complementing protein